MKRIVPMLLSLIVPVGLAADALHDMKPYPSPESGMERLVFRVPVLSDESDARIEVLVGRTIEVDCNRVRFLGSLNKHVAQGWGYPYYVLPTVAGPATTMMACTENQAKREAFVPVRGNGFFLRYNSKLPVVVYVPNGYEVRYRVWTPQGGTKHAAVE